MNFCVYNIHFLWFLFCGLRPSSVFILVIASNQHHLLSNLSPFVIGHIYTRNLGSGKVPYSIIQLVSFCTRTTLTQLHGLLINIDYLADKSSSLFYFFLQLSWLLFIGPLFLSLNFSIILSISLQGNSIKIKLHYICIEFIHQFRKNFHL